MKRYRRLRKLTPDPELFRRRATGATFRELAPDYGVSHTALSRYFARPEARKQLKQAEQVLRAEQQAAAACRSAEQRLEREVRRKATQQAALEREQLRRSRAVQARIAARRHRPSAYEAWLDDNDLRRPLTRAELYSPNDDTAAGIVSAGGGIEAVVEATGLRSRENVLGLIDPPSASATARPNRLDRDKPNTTVTKRSIQTRLTNPTSTRSPAVSQNGGRQVRDDTEAVKGGEVRHRRTRA